MEAEEEGGIGASGHVDESIESPKSDGFEAVPDAEVVATKRELGLEISELEWEFKHIKEALHAERVLQVDRKLQQLRAGEAPELQQVFSIIDESFRIRKQVCLPPYFTRDPHWWHLLGYNFSVI